MTRPILFLDVDGPLNPYAAKPTQRPEGYQTYRFFAGTRNWGKNGLRVWLNPEHGPKLLALPYDLVWGTTWEGLANKHIGPAIGLPELPVVHFGFEGYKMPDLVRFAAGRPFAWADDDITAADRAYVRDHHAAPFLLHHVSPSLGLLDADFDVLRKWAARVNEERDAPHGTGCACEDCPDYDGLTTGDVR
jgi:hypothetical protein